MIRFYKTLTDTTEELKDNEGTFSPKKIMLLQQTLEESKSICSVVLFTVKYKLDGLKEFIAMIENYFMNRKHFIKSVIKCEVVKLVTEVNVRRGWIFVLCHPEICFFFTPDLVAVFYYWEGSYRVGMGQLTKRMPAIKTIRLF